MSFVTRQRTAVAAALTLALAPVGIAAAAPTAQAATASGFTTVSTVGFPATAAVAPAAGEVYVAGIAGGVLRVEHRNAATGATTLAIPATATGTTVQLAASQGAGYALVTGGTRARLFRLTGTTVAEVTVPTALNGSAFTPAGLAADDTRVSLTGLRTNPENGHATAAVAHLDATGWTGSSFDDFYPDGAEPTAYSLGGSVVGVFFQGMNSMLPLASATSTGWAQTGFVGSAKMGAKTDLTELTGTAATAYTAWGYAYDKGMSTGPAVAPTGRCTSVGVARCVAPRWPVTAAAARADGTVVLGGADSVDGLAAAAPAGFALVPAPGATPVALNGNAGDVVLDIATYGTQAWALTRTGTTTTLQAMDVPVTAAGRAPAKLPTPPKPAKRTLAVLGHR